MFYIKQFLYAFLSTIGFAVIFNSPKDTIVKAGINGTVGWIIYLVTKDLSSSSIAGSFVGALSVGILGEISAKIFKKPSTTFIIPGIIPLVPGAGIYYTMLALTKKNFLNAADSGSQTLLVALALASGVIVSSALNRAIVNYLQEKKDKSQLLKKDS